jgi:cell wall assembly regulator SMI1
VSAIVLSRELLEDLADRWRAVDAPILEWLKPGLSDAEMDALTASLPFTLPQEARTWWGWHDGAEQPGLEGHDVGVGLPYMSLQRAIDEYSRARDQLLQEGAAARREYPDLFDEPAASWPAPWFPVSSQDGDVVVCDCGVASGEPSPIHLVDCREPVAYPPARAQSFGEMVVMWIEAIDSGFFYFDAEHRRWFLGDDPLPRVAWSGW